VTVDEKLEGGSVSVGLDVPLGSPLRPTWRGLLHLIALTLVVPLLVVLSVVSDGARSRAAVVVYAVGLCSMLAVSAVYHRFVHTVRARMVWRRADHATIFLAIAGTFSAFALSELDIVVAVGLLVVVWAAAVCGVVVKLHRFDRSHRFGAVLYLVTGWAGLALLPALRHRPVAVGLLLAGGVVYTVGAVWFSRRWPQLRPSTFSYHEVWHACTLTAAGLHLAAVWTVTA
jgi:hemolysin III